jgi:SAM-dependent MidA family methyltransferase
MLGNEVLDAMPVHVVHKNPHWVELGVGFVNQQFVWREFLQTGDAVQRMQLIDADQHLPDQYCTEINLNYEPWCKSLAESCDKAVLLLIDYGYLQAQYYHAQRVSGTLVCYYQHRVHPDPFIYPGLQDITAFVDFDAFGDAAIDAGFSIAGLASQADFLMRNGLLELMPDGLNELQQLEFAQRVKSLTLPEEMGEKFKVIALQKGLDLNFQGF